MKGIQVNVSGAKVKYETRSPLYRRKPESSSIQGEDRGLPYTGRDKETKIDTPTVSQDELPASVENEFRNVTELEFAQLQMSLLQIYEYELSDEFKSFLDQIRTNIETYTEARHKAQIERMIIIGKINEYRQSFPQRSSDHRLLAKAMTNEGWSPDAISNNSIAYKEYQRLMNSHSDWYPLAQAASVSQLLIMARAEDGKLSFYMLKYLKRHKKLPAVSAMRGYLAGWFDDRFQPKNKGITRGTTSSKEFDVAVVSEPSNTEVEIIEDNQVVLRQQLLSVLNELNMDDAFTNDQFKKELELHTHQLETLTDWSRAKKLKPKYV